jgi:hypothetical protein
MASVIFEGFLAEFIMLELITFFILLVYPLLLLFKT